MTDAKGRGMKAQRIRQMRREIGPVVPARVEVKFMRDVAGAEQGVQSLSAGLEAVIVLRSAIEIDLHAGEFCRARDLQGIISFPEWLVRRRTKDISQNLKTPGLLASAH